MVRVGGGWDTLEHYLDKHDPCRCRSGTCYHALIKTFKSRQTDHIFCLTRPSILDICPTVNITHEGKRTSHASNLH